MQPPKPSNAKLSGTRERVRLDAVLRLEWDTPRLLSKSDNKPIIITANYKVRNRYFLHCAEVRRPGGVYVAENNLAMRELSLSSVATDLPQVL